MSSGYRMPTRIHIGSGVLASLATVAERHRASRCLLVYDPGIAGTPWPERSRSLLESAGLDVRVFADVEPNPRAETVDRAAAQARADGIDLVVGVGGGSVLDAAKAVATAVPNEQAIATYEGRNRYARTPLPFIAVPTTCGTGSEVTWVSVLTVLAEHRKISVKGESMFPTDAVVDPDTLSTLPRELVASTAMDALTHAVEAYVGTASNPISDALAEVAVRLLFRHLPAAVRDIAGAHVDRDGVMRASTIAGMSFGNADVGGVHCLSETIGGLFDHPHGLLNAMLLAPVMRSHLDAAGPRLEALAAVADEAMSAEVRSVVAPHGSLRTAQDFVGALERLADAVGIPSFSTLGLDPGTFDRIAHGAVQNGSNGSNPRPMDAAAYVEILEDAAKDA